MGSTAHGQQLLHGVGLPVAFSKDRLDRCVAPGAGHAWVPRRPGGELRGRSGLIAFAVKPRSNATSRTAYVRAMTSSLPRPLCEKVQAIEADCSINSPIQSLFALVGLVVPHVPENVRRSSRVFAPAACGPRAPHSGQRMQMTRSGSSPTVIRSGRSWAQKGHGRNSRVFMRTD